MIAVRNFTHNGVRYTQGQKIDLPPGDIDVLTELGFVKEAPKQKAAKSVDDAA